MPSEFCDAPLRLRQTEANPSISCSSVSDRGSNHLRPDSGPATCHNAKDYAAGQQSKTRFKFFLQVVAETTGRPRDSSLVSSRSGNSYFAVAGAATAAAALLSMLRDAQSKLWRRESALRVGQEARDKRFAEA
ncbi:hypothetical protein AXG93_312s1120 [Marchantia polymorpha subsp. ruderalis]|uniref:Uncharacterized protein n=1 Tax=Marchantia polymorpha subsp. ruderalis TaxID=1480154 RepID=A0A176W7H8_MARPO|nr:hypothetical protein AXG93_312s1120 [Marchantia polymorpha subsp. ruderalis]